MPEGGLRTFDRDEELPVDPVMNIDAPPFSFRGYLHGLIEENLRALLRRPVAGLRMRSSPRQ
jgi:hypothetical protein